MEHKNQHKKEASFSSAKIIFSAIKEHKTRNAGLTCIVLLLSFVLCTGILFSFALKNGLSNMRERFGADIVVVPAGAEKSMEAILLKGEPNYFYLSQESVRAIGEVQGVKNVTEQFYLTSSSESCCSIPVQIIGFDPESDFSITPWIQKSLKNAKEISGGVLLAGSDISVDFDKTVRFYGQKFSVKGVLAKSGSGLDNAVFANRETLLQIISAAKEKGFNFIGDGIPGKDASSVLVKVLPNADVGAVAKKIESSVSGVQAVQTSSILKSVSETLQKFSTLILVSIILFSIFAFCVLLIVFPLFINERKKECAVFSMLGMGQSHLAFLLFAETVCVSLLGSILGATLSLLLVLPFSTFINTSLSLPYILPNAGIILFIFTLCVILASGLSSLASVFSVLNVCKTETYLNLKTE